MANTFFFEWEVRFIEFLQGNLPSFLISFFKIITELGGEMAIVCVGGFIYWCLNKKIGKRLCIYLGAANVFYPMIKNILLRSRPYLDHETIQCLKPAVKGDIYDLDVQGYSCPSGHASNVMTVYGGLFAKYKNTLVRVLAAVVIVLVCLSRNVLGVHYPTDVLAGLAAGLVIILLLDLLEKKCKTKKYYFVIAAVGLIGFFYCTSTDYYTGYGILIGALISDVFEERYVNFENATGILDGVLRMAGGLIIFLALSKLLKLPFPTTFLESKTFLSFLTRTVRYALIMFIDLGVYPMAFKYFSKIGKKKA